MSATFAIEASFIPRRHPHEVTNHRSGARLVNRINNWLRTHGRRTGVQMWAKLDPHHNVHEENKTYTVEVTPVTFFQVNWVQRANKDHAHFVKAIDRIWEVLRDRFGLVARVVTRKGNTDLEWPQGGMHAQMGMGHLFGFSTNWYRHMERFHRNLAMDYANRPYVRWLMAHWMGEGSRVVCTRADVEAAASTGEPISREIVFSNAIWHASSIEPRFMASAKNSYLTFEFRFVGMVENARQMCAAVRLLNAWMEQHKDRVLYGPVSPVKFNLTPARWDEMVTPEGARRHCRAWVESLGLDWADYEQDFFERNYLMRIAHGKME